MYAGKSVWYVPRMGMLFFLAHRHPARPTGPGVETWTTWGLRDVASFRMLDAGGMTMSSVA